jgi:glutamine synthetase
MALYYIGGLLKHARALSAIIAPTTNSYKRLVPGYEAPVNLAYSRRNRSAACRIPMYSANPKAKRVEFRPPDPSSNPYLAFAAMLMAGLDGVLNRIEPGEPLDKDIYDLSPEEMKSVPSMPSSLEEALICLEDDHQFLLKGDVFTEELIETFKPMPFVFAPIPTNFLFITIFNSNLIPRCIRRVTARYQTYRKNLFPQVLIET